MTTARTNSQNVRSVAGAALLAFGMFILYQNSSATVLCLIHALRVQSPELPRTVALFYAVSQAMRSYAGCRCSAEVFAHSIFVTGWPLLLVVAGTVLIPEPEEEQMEVADSVSPEKYLQDR